MDFRSFLDAFLADFFRLYPDEATQIGNHDHDGSWPDLTDAGRAARLAFLQDALRGLDELASVALTRDDAIDRELLVDEVRARVFFEERLDEYSWDALSYVYLVGGGLFSLLSREFAPLEQRLASARDRLRGLPALFDAARAALSSGRGRPVSRLHTEKAIERMAGVTELVDAVVAAADGVGDPAFAEETRQAAAPARSAAGDFTAWLRDELLPGARGDFRLGPQLYEEKLRHTLRTGLTSAEILARAEAAHAGVRGEMLHLARALWPAWMGSEEMTRDADALVRRVLDAIAADHPRGDELVDFCKNELTGIEAFVREHDVIGLTDEPLEITWTPEFLRSGAGAMLLSPGPLDRGQKSFFCITPMPEDWTPEQIESNLREDNARMLRLLTIHEAVPGHYLQLAYANRSPSLVRSIFASGVFAEGWAVYVTQVMMDLGYGAEDPALMLIHWKFYLRAITNAIIDIGIHGGEMEEEEAMYMMATEGYQERSEAAEKWNRARLTSTQLCEYFVGSLEMEDLDREARRRAASQGAEFVYRDHLESVLAHGTPPVKMLRRILFG